MTIITWGENPKVKYLKIKARQLFANGQEADAKSFWIRHSQSLTAAHRPISINGIPWDPQPPGSLLKMQVPGPSQTC